MPRYNEWDRETAICEHTRKCDAPALDQFRGGPCEAHKEEWDIKKAAKAKRAKAARVERSSLMADMGLVRGKDSRGRTIWE